MYRPQFAYPVANPPCFDQRCVYSFDATNVPVLAGTLAAGAALSKIPLLVDTDAPFFLRGFVVPLAVGERGGFTGLEIRLEDCKSNPLSDSGNTVRVTEFEYPQLYGETDGAGLVPLESDDWGVYFPAGGAPLLSVYNPTAFSISLASLFIHLHGVKRYTEAKCV